MDHDVIKTAFTTRDDVYYYVHMPFDLENAGASFQRAMTMVFASQIGRNLETYVDNIVVLRRPLQTYDST